MSLASYLSCINWVDLLLILIALRILYISLRKGIVTEIFKLLGVICALGGGVQFHTQIKEFVSQRLPLQIPLIDGLSFLAVVLAILFVFSIINRIFSFIFKVETISAVNKVGSFIAGIMRSLVVGGLFACLFIFSGIPYLEASLRESLSAPLVVKSARITYKGFYAVLNKFSPQKEKEIQLSKFKKSKRKYRYKKRSKKKSKLRKDDS